MKKVSILLFLFAFCALYSASARTFAVPVLQTQRVDLPWFFPDGVMSTQDPVEQRIEYERYLVTTEACMQGNGATLTIDSRSIKVRTNIKSTASVTDPDTNMEIVLDNYVKIGDQIRVSTLCEQRFITEQQKNVDVENLIEQTNIAADIQFEKQKNLTEGAIKSLAEQFDVTVEELKKRLPEKDQETGITFREIYGIPKDMKRSDFVPRELHSGYTPELPGVLGAAWLNTGIVYYNPQARILDYLTSKPIILAHEFMHTNSNLQKFPFADGFDAEIFASFPMLLPESKINFFFHPYPEEWREMAWVFFGFDFNQARKEIIRLNLGGNLVIDEVKYRKYFDTLEAIKKELNEFLPKALEDYYSNQLWWAAFNEKLKDPTIVFKMKMAQNFDPTLLGGREKTMRHIILKKDMIKEVTKAVLAKLDQGGSGNPTESARVPEFLLNVYNQNFSVAERDEIRKYFSKNPEAAGAVREMKVEEVLKLLKTIGQGGVR